MTLVVISVLLLAFATMQQAERQRIFLWHQAHHQAESLRSRANFMVSYPDVIPLEEELESFFGSINIVGVMFHQDHLDQPPTYTVAAGPRLTGSESAEEVRSSRRLARLEEAATNHARALIASLQPDHPAVSSVYGGSDNLRRLCIGFSDLNPTDEGFHFTWVAEAFPLPAALRQMIPIYLLTALLLAALYHTRKKYKTTQEAPAPA